jgi:hypothetical protein
MKKTPYIASLLLLAVAGCGGKKNSSAEYVPVKPKEIPPASLAPGEEHKILPAKVGNRWRYNVKRATLITGNRVNVDEDFYLEIKSVEDTPNGKKLVLETVKKDVTTERQVWELRKDGLYEISMGIDKTFTNNPPLLAVPFPLEKGKTFTYKGTGISIFGEGSNINLEGTIVGPDEVDTDAGRVSAFRVETVKNITKGENTAKEETTVWYAPNIGIVRLKQSVKSKNASSDTTIRLSQASLK